MIFGTHAIVYAEDASTAREFFRDVLGFDNVDAGGGWLIFNLPPAELGVHPSAEAGGSGTHELFFMCDDIESTMEELKGRGVEFTRAVENRGFGLTTALRVPGAGEIGLYEPRHETAIRR